MSKRGANKRLLAMHLYQTRFQSFARYAARAIFPAPITNWHVDVMSDFVATALDGNRRLILNAPPRCGKSFITSVALPAFILGLRPNEKIMLVAGSQLLRKSLRDRVRELMTSAPYRSLNPHVEACFEPTRTTTPHGGEIVFCVAGQKLTGRGADLIILDDPQTAGEAADPSKRDQCIGWIKGDLIPRLNQRKTSAFLLTMQRLAIEDVTDFLYEPERWSLLALKAVAEDDERYKVGGNPYTRHTGEVLCASLDNHESLIEQLDLIGAMGFSAQYQQSPIASESISGYFYTKPFDSTGWQPSDGWPSTFIGAVSMADIILHRLFGIGEAPPELYTQKLSDEQWAAATALQQARLLASLR